MKHHLTHVEKKVDEVRGNQDAVKDLAEVSHSYAISCNFNTTSVRFPQKVADTKEAESALKDERSSIGAPWGSTAEIEEALEDPANEQVNQNVYRSVTAKKPCEIYRLRTGC